jgi:general secretion pathway protein L
MLKRFVKQRVNHITAVYIEQDRVEVLTAHRQWRKWQVSLVERVAVGEEESVFDCLSRLNLRGRGRKNAGLLLLLPLEYYNFHRAVYPVALKDQLDEALSFDWQENIFHEYEDTLHFAGPPVQVEDHLSVPVFYIQRETYEKFQQAVSAGMFRSFALLPAAVCYGVFLGPESSSSPEELPVQLVARLTNRSQLEVHSFYRGMLLDSALVSDDSLSLRLLREKTRCLEGIDGAQCPSIELIEDMDSIERRAETSWVWDNLPVRLQAVRGKLVDHWMEHLFQQDEIRTFEEPLYLKPWKVPKVVWPVAAVVGLYALFALYQVHSLGQLKENALRLKKQTAALEAQWKPIEQLQTRIAKFQEDQKTLSQFNLEGYPLLELLTLLTQLTPDDTSLNYFSLRKGQVILRGESKSAIKYLPELSKIEGFGDVKFASPVTRNPASEQERFNVQLQLDVEKFRKSISDLQLDVPPARSGPEATQALIGAPGSEGGAALEADDEADEESDEEDDEDDEITEDDEEPGEGEQKS